jgi:hypothetical protein
VSRARQRRAPVSAREKIARLGMLGTTEPRVVTGYAIAAAGPCVIAVISAVFGISAAFVRAAGGQLQWSVMPAWLGIPFQLLPVIGALVIGARLPGSGQARFSCFAGAVVTLAFAALYWGNLVHVPLAVFVLSVVVITARDVVARREASRPASRPEPASAAARSLRQRSIPARADKRGRP